MSAPHIYHSALLLSPRTSITHEIYKNHASPLARVVQGVPDSWERVVATATFDDRLYDAVWSPCNRFIAVAKYQSVEVLDAVTLSQLSIFENPSCNASYVRQLSFSPDGRCLTLCVHEALISWDLQTGSPLGTINIWPEHSDDKSSDNELSDNELSDNELSDNELSDNELSDNELSDNELSDNELSDNEPSDNELSDNEPSDNEPSEDEPSEDEPSEDEPSEDEPSDVPFSFKHSKDGKVIAVAYKPLDLDYRDVGFSSFICTYDHHSGRRVGSYCFPEERIIYPIWTHDDYLRFATINPKSIRVWQSPFTLEHPPVEVASFPVPDGITDANRLLFLPTLSRLAFVLGDTIQVWDLKAPKLLLKSEVTPSTYEELPPQSSFSDDGRFFAYTTRDEGVHIWKESPTGYLPYQRLPFIAEWSEVAPRLSPNTESIIVSLNSKIHRLHTRDQIPSLPSVSTGGSRPNDFTLVFTPDENFAVFARKGGNTVTIIGLKSGEPKWNTDVGLEIGCVGMAGSTVIVVGNDSIVTWNLPGGDRTFNASINDIVQVTILDPSSPSRDLGTPYYMSISPDLSRVVVTRFKGLDCSLEVDDVATGSCLARISTHGLLRPRFAQDGREVWAGNHDSFGEQCEIIEDGKSGAIELKLRRTEGPSREFFQESSRGYVVTGGWWILSPSQKRPLWLPHRWRSGEWDRAWGGRFLGLLDGELSEAVILEFLE